MASGSLRRLARTVGGRPLLAYRRRRLRPVVSVVMPVYNVADYLPEALDSVLGQSLGELELIAVDDGSTDACLEILRARARHDPRVRVLTQANAGQGIARNLGVAHARGEFLTFVDSDDTLPADAFAHMIQRLRSSGSDFCVGGVRRLRNARFERLAWARTVHARDRIGTTLEEFPAAIHDIIACNRMFRTAFWRDRVGDFRGQIAYEDHVPMLAAYVRAERFDVLAKVTYNWRIRENRTSTGQQKARLRNLRDRIEVKREAYALLSAEAGDFVRGVWVGRTLETDFPPFIAHALTAADDYRAALADTYRGYLDLATDPVLDQVTVRQKVRAWLVAASRWDDVRAFEDYLDDAGPMPPTRVEDGIVLADYPDTLGFLAELPPRQLRLAPLECHLEAGLHRVEWAGDTLRLTGWAVRRGVEATEPVGFAVWLEDGAGRRVDLSAEPVEQLEAELWGRQRFASYLHGGFVAALDLKTLPADPGSWRLRVRVDYAGLRTTGPLLHRLAGSGAARDSESLLPGGVARARTRWDAADGFGLDVGPSEPAAPDGPGPALRAVDRVGDELVLAGAEAGATLTLGGPRAAVSAIAGQDGSVRLPLRDPGTGLALPGDGYRLTAQRTGGKPAPVPVVPALAGGLPIRLPGEPVDVVVRQSASGIARIDLEPPLPADAVGVVAERRLRDGYRRAEVRATGGILLDCFGGRAAADSQLAMDRLLAERQPDLVRRWTVRDRSVPVPEGAVGLLRGSRQWYDVLAGSAWLCANTGFGPWLTRRPGQRYLQTFAEHPYLPIGIARWRLAGHSAERIARQLRQVHAEWDTLVAPSREAAGLYREQFAFDGQILVTGSPRCDVLRTGDPAAARCRVLGEAGADRRTVLVAPASRDDTPVSSHRPLDLRRLSQALGPDTVVLLRRPESAQPAPGPIPNLLDVTHYPDQNDLILAADAAVLDYSALRFDFAVTGKPMLFHVPDLDTHLENPGLLLPYAETAPGPWLRDTDQLIERLRDLPAVVREYADAYGAFDDRFNALHDGAATGRVLDAWFETA